jgi:hypothetical protein
MDSFSAFHCTGLALLGLCLRLGPTSGLQMSCYVQQSTSLVNIWLGGIGPRGLRLLRPSLAASYLGLVTSSSRHPQPSRDDGERKSTKAGPSVSKCHRLLLRTAQHVLTSDPYLLLAP